LETWEALADYLSNGVYFEFPTDQFARKDFQSAIASELIAAITGTAVEPQQVVASLAKPMIDGRVVVWLDGEAGAEFNKTLLAHSMAWSQDDVVIGFNNWTANKMDFYLQARAGWDSCQTLVLSIGSNADASKGYPDYLTRRLDADVEVGADPGSLLDVNVALPAGVSIASVAENGQNSAFDAYPIDGNRTIVRIRIEILAGSEIDLVFKIFSGPECTSRLIRVSPMRQSISW
jgi:hypothetical protein